MEGGEGKGGGHVGDFWVYHSKILFKTLNKTTLCESNTFTNTDFNGRAHGKQNPLESMRYPCFSSPCTSYV